MVKRKIRIRRPKKSALDYIAIPRLPQIDLDPETKKGIWIVIILAMGAISLLGLFDLAGVLGGYLKDGLTLAFGWGKIIFPLVLLFWGYALYDEKRFNIRGRNYVGLVIFILSFQALLLMFVEYDRWPHALEVGQGGGWVGWLLADVFIKLLGTLASFLITFCLIIISLLLIFETSLSGLFGRESFLAKLLHPIKFILSKFKGRGKSKKETKEEFIDEEMEEAIMEEPEDLEAPVFMKAKEIEADGEEEIEDAPEEINEEEIPEFMSPKKNENLTQDIWWQTPTGIKIDFPLSLLNSNGGKPNSGDIEDSKEIIKKTLENFNIPVEMGQVSVGPTVTQFTLKPAEGVKLSKITNLGNDLALALAKHPIRIEAPIPGKSLVGVEVPNDTKAIVSLKEILSAKNYRERKNNMMTALGKDVSGLTWIDDITRMPHLLVAGATNSGKSVCLNAIIVSLMYQNNPDDLRFIMVDPKRVELTTYNNIPYLLTPVITDVHKTINALKWCLNEMDRRYDILSKVGTKNIQNYNLKHEIKMPYIVFVIDELADLMVANSRDIEGAVIRLAQMARAVGIHLILATQRPSVDVITGLIKANMPARIAFSVASGTDSRTILDSLGAEKLLGRGDMLYQTAELSKPKRLQGAFLGEAEIEKIVRFARQKGGNAKFINDIVEKQKVQGIGGVGLDGTTGDEDDLLLEAKETVINMGKASASLLQRKLRIGYARAASILDQLEEIGVIGQSNGAKAREILITKEQYEKVSSQGISGVSLHNRTESKAPNSFLGEDDEADIPPIFTNSEDEEAEETIEENEEDKEDAEAINESSEAEDIDESEEDMSDSEEDTALKKESAKDASGEADESLTRDSEEEEDSDDDETEEVEVEIEEKTENSKDDEDEEMEKLFSR